MEIRKCFNNLEPERQGPVTVVLSLKVEVKDARYNWTHPP